MWQGQSGRRVEKRVEEHRWHVRHLHPDKVAVAKHSIDNDHKIRFQETQILASKSGYTDRLIREATELDLHPNKINREDGLLLSTAWQPAIPQIKKKQIHIQAQLMLNHTPLPHYTTPSRQLIRRFPPQLHCISHTLVGPTAVLKTFASPLLPSADSAHTHSTPI